MESRKTVLMNLVENGLVGTAEESEGGMNGESSNDIYILSCAKQTVSGKLLNNTGSPARCSVTTWRGGVGGGQGASREGIYIDTKL